MSLKHRKLGRTSDQRRAMLRAMVTYLLENGQIKTTVTRAKEVAPMAEKMITLAKKNNLASYRQALGYITKESVANKLFKEIAPKYQDRNGGYTRIVRTGPRQGDAAEMAGFGYAVFPVPEMENSGNSDAETAGQKNRGMSASGSSPCMSMVRSVRPEKALTRRRSYSSKPAGLRAGG